MMRLVISAALLLLCTACNPRAVTLDRDEGRLEGADGASLYYRVMGSGSDTVVVVHGGPGAGMNSVIPGFEPLAERYTLVFYDQRGGGGSTLPDDTTKLHPHHFVEDLEAVRRYFNLEAMNIIAHSFGSVLVAAYARTYPDRLKRIVFHGATGPLRREAGRVIQAKAAALPSPDTALSNRASRLLRQLLRGTASDPVKTCREYEAINHEIASLRGEPLYEATTCSAPPEAVRYYYRYTAQLGPRYFGDWDFTVGLERVSAPLLVVYGEQDSLAHPLQRAWASAVANGRLLLVPGAGKGAASENPNFVLPAIDTFLRGAWPEHAVAVQNEKSMHDRHP